MLCKICGGDFASLGTHLRYSHKLDAKTYYDEYIRKENEGICPCCGKETQFRGLTKGYLTFCSSKCSNSSTEVNEKKKETTKTKYHDENFRNIEQSRRTRYERYGQFNSEECIEKIRATKSNRTLEDIRNATEKSRTTRLNKYFQWRAPDTTEKIAETKLERYGSTSFNNRNKAIDTCLAKYGVSHPNKLFLKDFIAKNNTAELLEDNGELVVIKCKKCGEIREISRKNILTRETELLCDLCNEYPLKANGRSYEEEEFASFISEIYSGEIRMNDRTVLDGLELDVYLPERKLAFEFDGLYWHSELFVKPRKHLEKTEICEKNGIQLIHVFEDEWLQKQEIVKSRIRGLLGLNERIFARKCSVKEVDTKTSRVFLQKNHIQGNCSSKYNLGLFHNNELVSLMTFGKSRFSKTEFELLRFCNKLNTNVVGGASKLLAHFVEQHREITNIVSYADRRWSKGNLYEKLGFSVVSKSIPNYFYFRKFQRESRMKYQKHKLVKMGYDEKKTEKEIMDELGFLRIYDCGTIKFSKIVAQNETV